MNICMIRISNWSIHCFLQCSKDTHIGLDRGEQQRQSSSLSACKPSMTDLTGGTGAARFTSVTFVAFQSRDGRGGGRGRRYRHWTGTGGCTLRIPSSDFLNFHNGSWLVQNSRLFTFVSRMSWRIDCARRSRLIRESKQSFCALFDRAAQSEP